MKSNLHHKCRKYLKTFFMCLHECTYKVSSANKVFIIVISAIMSEKIGFMGGCKSPFAVQRKSHSEHLTNISLKIILITLANNFRIPLSVNFGKLQPPFRKVGPSYEYLFEGCIPLNTSIFH